MLSLYNEYEKKINFSKLFEEEFNRIINCFKEILDIEYIFRGLYKSFEIEFYILLTNKTYGEYNAYEYYNLNKLSQNNIEKIINDFIKFYGIFYEKEIKKYINNNGVDKFNFYSNNYIINYLNNKSLRNKYDLLINIFYNINYNIRYYFMNFDNYSYLYYDLWDNFSDKDEIIHYYLENTYKSYEKFLDFNYDFGECSDNNIIIDNFDYFDKINEKSIFLKKLLKKYNKSLKNKIEDFTKFNDNNDINISVSDNNDSDINDSVSDNNDSDNE